MSLKRVLHIVTKMDRAGLETLLMNYYRCINRDEIQFDFLTHRVEAGNYDEEILKMGGKIFHMHPIRPLHFFKYLNELELFFKEHSEYSIIHSHIDALSTFPLYAAKKAGIPVRIAHSHNIAFDKDFKILFRYISKQLLPLMATEYKGCSKAAVRFMFGKRIYNTGNYSILHNAIDVKSFIFNQIIREEYRKQLNLNGKFVVGHIGRFAYQKNHDFIIDIFADIYEKHNNSVLLLVGNGVDKPKIEKKVKFLGLENVVKFLGVRSDVSQLMQAMDVFLFPSRFEGLPVTLIEAQAAGLPCLVSADVITKEVKITELINFIPLKQNSPFWAEQALNQRLYRRTDYGWALRDAGYDILVQAKGLEAEYKQLMKIN